MASKKPELFREEFEYHVITPSGRSTHTFDDLGRAEAYFRVVRAPGWRLAKLVRRYYDISPVEVAEIAA